MRILLLSARYPDPADRGDARRVLHVVGGLAEVGDVALLSFGSGPPLPVAGVRVRGIVRGPASALLGNARIMDPLLPAQVRLFLDERMRQAVDEEVAGFRPDVVHASTARMAPYLDRAAGARRHLDLIDALSLNMSQAARRAAPWQRPAYMLEAALLRRYEARAVARATSASLVSDADRRLAPGLDRAVVISNGVDLDAFPYRVPADRLPVVLFFGNLGYVHNVAAARYVAGEVLPRLLARTPEATLRLAGARPAASIRRLAGLPGLEVVGPVEDMAAELHRSAVALIPLLSGSGMKNKVLEAFAAGTPVVANALALEGIPGARAGEHYLRGETADEQADACRALLADAASRVRLAQRAHGLVRREYGWSRRIDELVAAYG
jgi:glycosyltransferase involved in cell wall biosynthesis